MEQRITAVEKSIDKRKVLIAASRGDSKELECLLKKEVDVNFSDEDGYTALHYAVESGKLDIVQQLLKDKEVNVFVESNDNRSPLDIAREINNQDIIDIVVERIIDNTFEVLEESSNIDKPDRPSSDTGLDEVAEKIKQTENKIESCLEFLKKINAVEREADQKDISYDQANILIYFLETFALEGDPGTKDQLKKYFAQYYTELDRKLFSDARKRLLKISGKKLRLEDIGKFINGDIKSFFAKLEEYVQYVQYVKMLKNFLHVTASELRSRETEENGVQSFLKNKFDEFTKKDQMQGKIKNDEVFNFIAQFYPGFHKTKDGTFEEPRDEVVDSFFIELQKYVRSTRQESFFLKTLKGKECNIGEEIDVGSYVKKEFEKLMVTSYTEENITQELLFTFVVNFYPTFQKETQSGLRELSDLRNKLIHDFHKYGAIEFGKEIFRLKHTLFKYYFAQQVNQALCAIEPDEDPETINKTFKNRLETFKDRYANVMKKEYFISTDEAEDFFGYKFSQVLFPGRVDHSETLVDQYLKFMVIIDCAKDSPIDEEQDEKPQSRKELNALSRREIFEEFCRLERISEHSHRNSNRYNVEILKFEKRLLDEYGVPSHHFHRIFDHSNESKKISDIIKSLKKIKEDHKLPYRVVIFLYDQCSNNKDSFGSDKHKRLLEEKGISDPSYVISKFKCLPSDEMLDISIGEEKLSISRRKVISNMLNTFYNAYHAYTIQFNIEEIFNDKTFLDYLVVNETETTEEKVEDLVVSYLKLTLMVDRDKEETYKGSTCKEISCKDRKKIFEGFCSLKKLKQHLKNNRDLNYYEKEKQEFKELVFGYGIRQQDFDNLYKCCIEENYDLTDEEDGVNKVKVLINYLKSELKKHKILSNEMIASLFKEAMKGQVCSKQVRGVLQPEDEVGNIVKILNNLPNPDKNEVSVQLGSEKWSVDIKKVTCDMLEVFEEKLKLKTHNYMIIKKLLEVADYTAPYIVKLITKVKSDEIIEKNDLVRLVEILLMKEDSLYMKSLNELLNLRSRKLNLYEVVCNKIAEPSFDIYSMRLIFKEYQHVKGILTVLIYRIRIEDESRDKLIELSKKVFEIFVNSILASIFSDYEEALEVCDHGLKLIKVIKSTLTEPNDSIIADEYNIKFKMAKLKIYQGKELNKNQSPVKDQANKKYNEALDILRDIPDDVHPQSLLASGREAYIHRLLKQNDKAYQKWELLYKNIVKLICVPYESSTELYSKEMYTEIERSEKYKILLALSVECNKYLNILDIRKSMTEDLLYKGYYVCNKVELCKKALDIHKELYTYQKANLGPRHKSTLFNRRCISKAHILISQSLSNKKNYQNALKHSEYALLQHVRVNQIQIDVYGKYYPTITTNIRYILKNLDSIALLNVKLGDVEAGSMENRKKKRFYEKALRLYDKIYEYRKRYLGEEHKSTLNTKRQVEFVSKKLHESRTQSSPALYHPSSQKNNAIRN